MEDSKDREAFFALLNSRLKQLCRENGLNVGGSKAALVNRLLKAGVKPGQSSILKQDMDSSDSDEPVIPKKRAKRKIQKEESDDEFSDEDEEEKPKKRKKPAKKKTKKEESDDDFEDDGDDFEQQRMYENVIVPEEEADWKVIESDSVSLTSQHYYPWEEQPKEKIKYHPPFNYLWNTDGYQLKIEDRDKKTVGFAHLGIGRINFSDVSTEEFDKLWKWDIKHRKKEEANAKHPFKFTFTMQINVSRLEFLVNNGLPVPARSLLFDIVKRKASSEQDFDLEEFKQAVTPTITDNPQKQPNRLTLNLYDYQLNSLSWMKQVEDTSADGWQFSTLATWKDAETSILFDLDKNRFYKPEEAATPKISSNFRAKGGVLADEMGLGKTVSMIALILSNPCTLTHFRNEPEDEFHFNSKATLIVCPNHLCKQWVDHIQKHTKPKLKVALVTTIPQHRKYTYADFKSMDVVVVSFQFLKNKNYLKIGGIQTDRPLDTKTFAMELKRRGKPLQTGSPLLENFFWHRIIIDEGHEVITKNNYFEMLNDIPSRYRWYVSGTPFPTPLTFEACLDYLAKGPVLNGTYSAINRNAYRKEREPVLFRSRIEDIMFNNLFWRNTKKSVGNEYRVPPLVEELILLNFSEVEATMYRDARDGHDNGKELRIRQLCCHLQISDQDKHVLGSQKRTLEEIRTIMIDYKKKEISRMQNQMDELEESKEELEEEYSRAKTETSRAALQSKLRHTQDQMNRLKKEITHNRSSVNYFQSIIPTITQSSKEPCVICLEEITDLTITSCGHIFCTDCISGVLSAQKRCPICRTPLEQKNLTQVIDPNQKQEVEDNKEVQDLISKYGTKMARLITYCNATMENEENRIIIFSQWDSLLHLIGDTLNECGIKNVYVKGNVHQRNKAIDKFKTEENIRVIMLSLEHAASGINLIEATHIILMDPVAGTKEEASAIESQAVGRAHRQGQTKQVIVVRMIIKNTIEYEYYLRNTQNSTRLLDTFNVNQETPSMVRTRSVPTLLANTPPNLVKSGSIKDLIINSP